MADDNLIGLLAASVVESLAITIDLDLFFAGLTLDGGGVAAFFRLTLLDDGL